MNEGQIVEKTPIHNHVNNCHLNQSKTCRGLSPSGKNSTCQRGRQWRHGFNSWLGKIPWRRKWQPISVFSPGKSHGQRSLVGYSPWGCTELNTIEVAWHACRVPGYSVLQILRVCASLVAQTVKRLPTTQETQVRSLGREDPLEKEMATHFSTLAWKIPWMEEPGRL